MYCGQTTISMKSIVALGVLVFSVAVARAANTVTPWVPVFQGIDQATGTNEGAGDVTLSVNALRVDLQNPDIQLRITPPITNNYVPDSRETFAQTPREFMREHGVQVAINSGYFAPGSYSMTSGTPVRVEGVVISEGRLVSAQTRSNDSLSAMLFTTNNQPYFVYVNWPATNTNGIFNAVSGMYPLVSNGVNISYVYTNSMSDTVHQRQPRTAFGLSEDDRYLILMTIDGRQELSDGALDYETADFLLLFGAWKGMNMDGGGSTTMVKVNECGDPVDVNQNSFQFAVGRPGSQRSIGCNFGVYAPALPTAIKELTVLPGSTTATITWRTDMDATTQVEYGPTPAYGNATPLDTQPRQFHVATVSGLVPGSNYYYRAISVVGSDEYRFGCRFSTTDAFSRTLVFGITNRWKYHTNNLVNWKTSDYDDTSWFGPSNACFHIENTASVPFPPRNTLLPPGFVVPIFRTYYFRTPFVFSGSTAGLSLTFSNYIDDGAVFYLNGAELARIRVPPTPNVITNGTFASGTPCGGTPYQNDAAVICPDVFTITGSAMTNLVEGTNMVAVEVHNVNDGTTSQDILFGGALFVNRQQIANPELFIAAEGEESILYWNGQGFTLQQSSDFSATNNWSDVSGPVTQSPFTVTNAGTVFYRLRN